MGATPKDRKMQLVAAQSLPLTGSKAAALRAAGYQQSTIDHATARTWARVEKNPAAKSLLAKAGVSDMRLATKLSGLLDASTKDGQPDHQIQFRTSELCLTILGLTDDGQHLEKAMSTYISILVRVVDEQLPKEARSPFLRAIATAMSEAVAASKALPVEPAGEATENAEQAAGGDLEAGTGGA